jgi:hypothetical protein
MEGILVASNLEEINRPPGGLHIGRLFKFRSSIRLHRLHISRPRLVKVETIEKHVTESGKEWLGKA